MQILRLPVAIISSVALLVAQIAPGFAQSTVPSPARPAAFSPAQDATSPNPVIVNAFKAYPKGGDLLSKRIEDIIVNDPKLAPDLAKYVQRAPDLNKEQKQAAFRGLAAALNRMGINAADMAVKAPIYKAPPAPPPVAECPECVLLALAAIGGLICLGVCPSEGERPHSP